MTKIYKMPESQIKELKDQIKEIGEHATTAMEAAKASASIAYQASVENVKSNKNLEAKLDAYITSDMEWKKRAEPVIELGNNTRGASKAVLYLAGIVVAIGGAIQIIRAFIFHK